MSFAVRNDGKGWRSVNSEAEIDVKTETFSASQPLLVPNVDQEQVLACKAIDAQAGATRSKYITTVEGQAETYINKSVDAASYKAAGYPFGNLSSYPWIQAEAIAINGAVPTAAQAKSAVDGILAAQAAWITLGAKIEQERRTGSVNVTAATTVAAVQLARDAAIAALSAL